MVTKFGNLHVQTNQVEAVLQALREIASSRLVENVREDKELTGLEALVQQANYSREVYYVRCVHNGWVSVLNDWFSWGNVEEFGEELSSYIAEPVLTCSNFDDDVLEINLYRNGEHLTGHTWCSHFLIEEYGIEDKEADPSILVELFGHQHIETISVALQEDNREQVVEQFESILEVPLWIHSDWFSDIEDDEIIKQYAKYDFNK